MPGQPGRAPLPLPTPTQRGTYIMTHSLLFRPGGAVPRIDQPRRVRLRIYDGTYEVLHNRVHDAHLDIDPDDPISRPELRAALRALTRQAIAAGEPMDAPRLVVEDWATGAYLLDVVGD